MTRKDDRLISIYLNLFFFINIFAYRFFNVFCLRGKTF